MNNVIEVFYAVQQIPDFSPPAEAAKLALAVRQHPALAPADPYAWVHTPIGSMMAWQAVVLEARLMFFLSGATP